MKHARLTALSAVLALMVSGFVPAPPSVSVFASSAEAQGKGSPKGAKKKKSTRKGKKKKASSKAQADKAAKSAKRKAEGKTSKGKVRRVAGKQAGSKGRAEKTGDRHAGKYTTIGQVAVSAAKMGVSASRGQAAGDPPPPVPPRARKVRKTAKKTAPASRMRAAGVKKDQRRARGYSSVLTRQVRQVSATQVAGPPPPPTTPPPPLPPAKVKQGKKSKFYFNPVPAWLSNFARRLFGRNNQTSGS